jgi:hypothetical protein
MNIPLILCALACLSVARLRRGSLERQHRLNSALRLGIGILSLPTDQQLEQRQFRW